MKKLILVILLYTLYFILNTPRAAVATSSQATVYYSIACSECNEYLKETLIPTLQSQQIKVELKDYINQPEYRGEMSEMIKSRGVSDDFLAHMITFVEIDGRKIVLAGHIPREEIIKALDKDNFIVWQEKMHEEGPVRYGKLGKVGKMGELEKEKWLLPTVLWAGFLDGFHPCAFAVLIFFIAFLLTLNRTTGSIFKMGGIYLLGIYLAYLAIGLGLMQAVVISDQPYFFAKVGSILLIGLGLINIGGALSPRFPIKLEMPKVSSPLIKSYIEKATLPAALIAGFLVGLCSLPCAGGIYVAITSLLAAKTTFLEGFLYLLIYNFMFILPPLFVLILASNRAVLAKIAVLEKENERGLKLALGLGAIILALVILRIVL